MDLLGSISSVTNQVQSVTGELSSISHDIVSGASTPWPESKQDLIAATGGRAKALRSLKWLSRSSLP